MATIYISSANGPGADDFLITKQDLIDYNSSNSIERVFVEYWDASTVYSEGDYVGYADFVWYATQGMAAGELAPDVNGAWKQQARTICVEQYSDDVIYAVDDVVLFDHTTIGKTFFIMVDDADVAVNGTFTGDTGWTKGTNWAITSYAEHTAGSASDLSQDVLTNAEKYLIKFTVSNTTAGSITAKCGSGASGTARTANGTYTEYLTCTTSTLLIFSATSDFDGRIDDVTCVQVGVSPEDDLTKWQVLDQGEGLQFWNSAKVYVANDYVFFEHVSAAGNYRANTTTSAGESPVTASSKWDLVGGDMLLSSVQTVTGAKTFEDTKLIVKSPAGTGTAVFKSTDAVAVNVTMPTASGTLLTSTQVDTLIENSKAEAIAMAIIFGD